MPHAHTHVCTRVYTHICTHVCARVYKHAYTRPYTCLHTHVDTQALNIMFVDPVMLVLNDSLAFVAILGFGVLVIESMLLAPLPAPPRPP